MFLICGLLNIYVILEMLSSNGVISLSSVSLFYG